MRISDWSSDVCSSDLSLPNWAFLIERGRLPAKGEFIFFDPPASALLRRHFGARPRMFGKKVYAVAGDVIAHDGMTVTINGVPTVRMKPFTKAVDRILPGATGVVPQIVRASCGKRCGSARVDVGGQRYHK